MTTKWMNWVVKELDRTPRGDAAGETKGQSQGVNLVMTAIQQSLLFILRMCQTDFQKML